METIKLENLNLPAKTQLIVVLRGKKILIGEVKQRFIFDFTELSFLSSYPLQVHRLTEKLFILCLEDESISLPSFHWVGLRELLGSLNIADFKQATGAVQTAHWLTNHRFCGCCGAKTQLNKSEACLQCTTCNTQYFPRIYPCVIGLVTRGNACILARGSKHPPELFSTLAGFIETGETAEEAFAREVEEEVGVKVKNIRYVGSQHWPFPAQLMLGFEAEYDSGELEIDGNEIIEAGWFSCENLPSIPPESTISGQIIRGFVERNT